MSEKKIGGKTNTIVPNSRVGAISGRACRQVSILYSRRLHWSCASHTSGLQKALLQIITKKFNNQLLINTIKIFCFNSGYTPPPITSLIMLFEFNNFGSFFFGHHEKHRKMRIANYF